MLLLISMFFLGFLGCFPTWSISVVTFQMYSCYIAFTLFKPVWTSRIHLIYQIFISHVNWPCLVSILKPFTTIKIKISIVCSCLVFVGPLFTDYCTDTSMITILLKPAKWWHFFHNALAILPQYDGNNLATIVSVFHYRVKNLISILCRKLRRLVMSNIPQ